jgi:GNAT superfamily N-acetyltransferase
MRVYLTDPTKPAGADLVEAEVMPLDATTHLPALASWKAALVERGEEDAAWDWSVFVADMARSGKARRARYEAYVIVRDGQVQAAMMIETRVHRSRTTKAPLVYVEYVAVAPWNRRAVQDRPRFAGCGVAIITMAIERSRTLGYGGRIGPHSLPRARGFYERMGLTDLGNDPREAGLHYFEL